MDDGSLYRPYFASFLNESKKVRSAVEQLSF
jgi:hypothetical protein